MIKLVEKILFYKDLYSFCQAKKREPSATVPKTDQIPKTVHYCWFGKGAYTPLIKMCMASWDKILPEYKQVLWNEENFPFDRYPFAKEAYDKKKYAFVSDVARLHALYTQGGVYLDTDVEMLKPLDEFLKHGAFSSYEAFGGMSTRIPTGLMAAKERHPWIELLLSWYEGKHFAGYHLFTPNTRLISKITELCYGIKLDGQPFVLENDTHIYPSVYFCPEHKVSEQSYCIHHFSGSWAK